MSQHGRPRRSSPREARRCGGHASHHADAWLETVLRSAADWPVADARIRQPVGRGIRSLVTRQMPDGVAVAGFLVVTYCLGVKDATANDARQRIWMPRAIKQR